MKINREEHPAVQVGKDIDGKVHLVDSMGGPWCEDEDIELDGSADPETPEEDWCAGCIKSGMEEGAFL